MTTKNFVANNGDEGSVEIKKRGQGIISPLMIGFISKDGQFFFDTDGDQVQIPFDQLKELVGIINDAKYIFYKNVGA